MTLYILIIKIMGITNNEYFLMKLKSIKVIAALWVTISFGNKEIHLYGYIFVHIIKCTGSNTTLNMGIV